VAPAKHLALALDELGVPGVHVIPNPVDLVLFRPRARSYALLEQLGIASSDLIVLHMSNLKALKRVEDLIAAVALLPRGLAASCLIVGKGENRPALEELVAAKGLQARIRFLDWVEYEHVPEFLSIADVVVMPSASEGQARLYLEAQACGRTLVASDIPAAREVVEDGETGLLFRTGDPESLAARICLAAANPSLRAANGRKALKRVRSHGLGRVAAAYETVLERIVSSSTRHCQHA
jgi:glycosyltransferase involved in cell wall biosynthesis